MPKHDRLAEYRSMRDFTRTAEPDGNAPGEAKDGRRFVVQEHHATALHWDFRLERDGVLVSWAVPKGIPPDPKVNHRAIHTEDHPLSYIDFAGDIPEGEYGGGQVTVWDHGTYEEHKFRDEEVMVTLHGERVQGKYVLFRTGDDPKAWMMHRMDPPQDPDREAMPRTVEPMLAQLAELPADEDRFGFEIKWDGIRVVAFIEGGRVRLQSRNLLDITKQYPELADLGEQLGSREAVLDGEMVVLDEQGVPSFARLQNRMGLTRQGDIRRRMETYPAAYMIFDLLYFEGHSLMKQPYRERRALLESLGLEGPAWRVPAYRVGDGRALLAATKAQGIEGIVGKRLDSTYEPGRRNTCWIKVKNSLAQEFVIGGYTPGAGNRYDTFGALLLGYYDRTLADAKATGEPQRLHFAGKVGTGFSDRTFRELMPKLQKLRTEHSPFAVGEPEAGSAFVEPRLVAQVDFIEWTKHGTLRHPSFEGLREDKEPLDVVLETPARDVSPPEQEVVGKQGKGGRERAVERRATAAARPARAANGEGERVQVEVDGRALSLSNLDKVLYPAAGFTKAQVIDYYTRIAPVMLPHLHGRPMTLKRYPNGVEAAFFYEKQCPSHAPSWVQTKAIFSGSNGRNIDYCLVNDLPTLVWLANLATLEMHPLLSRAEDVLCPTSVVFDLDPGPPANVVDCARVALRLRELFAQLGLECVAKTSGSKGMQLYVPLNTPVDFEQTKAWSHAIARLMERAHPGEVLSNMSKALRAGKVFIDWSQNDDHKTTVAVYSLRARERPTVSTPVTWDELEAAVRAGDPRMLTFEAGDVLTRADKLGDLFRSLIELRQELPGL